MASTTVGSNNAIVLEALNQHNYEDWSSRVKTYLVANDLWDIVGEKPPAETAKPKSWWRKDAGALHAIKISCGTEMFSFIRESKTAGDAWNVLAKKFIKQRDKENNEDTGCTALRKAAMKGKVRTVKQLLSSTNEEELKKKDGNGRTVLDRVIVASSAEEKWIQIVRAMVEKKREIVEVYSWKYLPVVRACSRKKWEMAHFLLRLTSNDALLRENGRQGAQLICMCIWRPKGLDIAWQVLQECPKLAMADNGFGQQPMLVLAGTRRAFPSGARLTLWQKLIYKCIRIQPIQFRIPESCIEVSESESEDKPSPKKELCNAPVIFFKRAIKGASNLLGIKHVYKIKLNHFRFQEFLSFMVKVMKDLDNFTPAELKVVRTSLFKATAQGHVEFIKHMREATKKKKNSAVAQIVDDKKKSIFQYVIECRQEKIYNLIYDLKPKQRSDITHKVAKFNTNMLHSAANLSLVTHFNHIQGASLQMQHELQWFKEVESMLPSEMQEYVNTSKLTARELFTKNHKQLKNEAEISMKGIASSCMTVGALIVTMTFAIAFTVPGGTNSDSGLPMFMHKKLFKIFILSDTISLISSAASVITFLGLLTSTYAEDDFLWHLPTKLMIGLSTLFISIAAMMIAFICSLTIMLDGEAKMIITVIVFASLPVVSFTFFVFPLLYEICRSTYGPSIFCKKSGTKH